MIRDALNTGLRKLPEWLVYVVGFAPALWLFWLALNGHLGVDPVKALEHRYGLIALQVLIAGLCVTPLRQWFGINLMRFRRALGLIAFGYVVMHLLVWLVLDVQIPSQIWADILKRPYITIGIAGFALLIPLAVTSNRWSIRRLGPRWARLHRLVYVAVALGGLHFIMLSKGFQLEPMLYLGAIILLLALRLVPARRPVRA